MRKYFNLGKQFYWSNKWYRRSINENSFAPQNESHTANLSFTSVLKLFRREIDKKNFPCSIKSYYFRKKLTIPRKLFYKRWKSWGNILTCGKNFFWSNKWNGKNINEKVLLLKMSHTQLNCALLVFWSILARNWQISSLLGQKIEYLSKNLRITRKVIFFAMRLKLSNHEECFV